MKVVAIVSRKGGAGKTTIANLLMRFYFPASGRVDPYNLALIYAKLGEKSAAFKWLDQACRERSSEIVYLDVEPIFDAIRSDPRFAAVRECVGLPVKARS